MEKRSWLVEMKCVVIKQVICGDCTEDQARISPWLHVDDQNETEQIDWEVLSVKPND